MDPRKIESLDVNVYNLPDDANFILCLDLNNGLMDAPKYAHAHFLTARYQVIFSYVAQSRAHRQYSRAPHG